MKRKAAGWMVATLVLVAGLLVGSAQADTLTWDNTAGGAINDGAGAWLGAGLWNNGSPSITWTSGADAIFGVGGTGGAVTLASPTTVNSLTMNAFGGTYTLGTAGQAITLTTGITKNASGAGALTIISPLSLGGAQTWLNNSSANINMQAATTLNGNLTIDGSGITAFNAAASIIGGTGDLIKNGTGHINHDAATPAHTFTGNVIVNGGSIGCQSFTFLNGRNTKLTNGYLGGRHNSGYTWSSGLGTGANQIQITGGTSGLSGEGSSSSTFQIGGAGSTLVWGASGEGTATGYFNPSVFLANGDARVNANGKGSLNNGIDLNGADRTITSWHWGVDTGTGSGFTISGAIINSTGSAAGLIKTGGGNLILNGNNTFNGGLTISGGRG